MQMPRAILRDYLSHKGDDMGIFDRILNEGPPLFQRVQDEISRSSLSLTRIRLLTIITRIEAPP
jgi:hypothetical protein